MFLLHNMRIEPSNIRKKKKEPPNVTKNTVKCNIGTGYCEDETVKCEKK